MRRGENLFKHGLTGTPEHRTWMNMMIRCTYRNRKDSHLYSRRGIKVCPRWKKFENFLADMGAKPSEFHTIDRWPDNNGNYEPGNCRWATKKEQSRNCRHNRVVTANGQALTLVEWSELTGIKRERIADRLNRGWPPEAAVGVQKISRRERDAKGRYVEAAMY